MATAVKFTVPPDSGMVFANHAVVQNTPTDIIIRFCLVDPERGERHRDPGNPNAFLDVEAPTIVSVFLPPAVAHGLVGALSQVLEIHQRMLKEAADAD